MCVNMPDKHTMQPTFILEKTFYEIVNLGNFTILEVAMSLKLSEQITNQMKLQFLLQYYC